MYRSCPACYQNNLPESVPVTIVQNTASIGADALKDAAELFTSADVVDNSLALAQTPLNAASVQVTKNGVYQKYGVDYTVTGTLVVLDALTLSDGDSVQVRYQYLDV